MAAHHPILRADQTIEYDGEPLVVDVWQMPWSTMDDHDPVGVAELGPTLSVLVRRRGNAGRWKTLKALRTGEPPERLARPRIIARDPVPGDRIERYDEDVCMVLDVVSVTEDEVGVLYRQLGNLPQERKMSRSDLFEGYALGSIYFGQTDPRRAVQCPLCGHVRHLMSSDTAKVLCEACMEPLGS